MRRNGQALAVLWFVALAGCSSSGGSSQSSGRETASPPRDVLSPSAPLDEQWSPQPTAEVTPRSPAPAGNEAETAPPTEPDTETDAAAEQLAQDILEKRQRDLEAEQGEIDSLHALRQSRLDEVAGGEVTVDSFTEAEEEEIGMASARSILSRFDALPPDLPLSRYVGKVGALLAAQSGRPDLPYRFVVVIDDSVNAFAVPYGWVFVTTGALRFLENEAELAVVLAHEIGHVVRKHGLKKIVDGILDIQKRSTAARADELSGEDPDEALKEAQAQMYRISDLIVEGKGRPDEEEADRIGLVIAARTGYDPRAALTFLTRLASAVGPTQAQPKIFRSHPHMVDRIVAARQLLGRLPQRGAVLAERFQRATRQLR